MRAVTGLLLVAVLTLTGCNSAGPSAEEWAGDVCVALDPWRAEIDDLTTKANEAMKPESPPADAKKDLLALLSGAAEATEEARKDVEAAGVPDVDDGAKIAKEFAESLAGTRDAYRTAHDGIEKLDAEASGFYDDVTGVMEQLAKDYDAVPREVTKLNSDELRKAFASVKRCE